MNQLVLSGTATLVLSGTRSSCYRGPESSISTCFPWLSSRSNLERHIKPCTEVHHAPPPPTAGPHRAFRSRIAVQHFRNSTAGEGAQVSTPANQKSFGLLLTEQTTNCIGVNWQWQAVNPACPQKPYRCFTAPKAYGAPFKSRGAAA